VSEKAFEVVAECAMAGLPTGADVNRVMERIERARRRNAAIAHVSVQSPAVYKDRAYTLITRFLVWAGDGPRAMDAVGSLLQGAGIHSRGMHLSGRALVDADLRSTLAGAPAAASRAARSDRRLASRKRATGPASGAKRAGGRSRGTVRRKAAASKRRPTPKRAGRTGARRRGSRRGRR